MLCFFPRDVLDEILNLIESVFEGFPTYSWNRELTKNHSYHKAELRDMLDKNRLSKYMWCNCKLSHIMNFVSKKYSNMLIKFSF